MISWKNPKTELRNTSLDDYMLMGPVEGMRVVKEITGAENIHAVGCIGGSLLATTMGWERSSEKGKKSFFKFHAADDFGRFLHAWGSWALRR